MALEPIPESATSLNSDPLTRQSSSPGPSSSGHNVAPRPLKKVHSRKISGATRKISAPGATLTRFPSGRYRSRKVSMMSLQSDKNEAHELAALQQRDNKEENLIQTEESRKKEEQLEDKQYQWVRDTITYKVRTGSEELEVNGQKKTIHHTKETPTDTFGHMEFVDRPGDKPKTAKYIRVSPDTKADDLYTLFTEHWQVEEPNIIISVTGGAQDFNLDPELSRLFKKGLVNAAKNTGAWITTGGTNHGVMSYVGDAIAEQSSSVRNNLTLIGFVSWGVIHGRDKLVFNRDHKQNQKSNLEVDPNNPEYKTQQSTGSSNWRNRTSALRGINRQEKKDKMRVHLANKRVKKYSMKKEGKSRDILLNPNHSHFVFVDDGSSGSFGVEIDLRSKFESCVSLRAGKPKSSSGKSNPSSPVDRNTNTSQRGALQLSAFCKAVCVLLEGGPNSLETVKRSLDVGTPVVIAKDSGRAADVIAFAKENCLSGSNSKEAEFSRKIAEQLRRQMTKSFTFKESEREAKLQIQLQFLKEICSKDNDNLVTIYSIRDPHNNDLDKALLGALMKAMQNKPEASQEELVSQLIFAVRWNRADTAAKYIFDKNRQDHWPPGFLNEIFMECCLDNKHEFVKLLLNNGVRLHDFKFVYHIEELFSVLNTRSDLMYDFLKSIRASHRFENNYLAGVEKGIRSLIGKGFRMSFLDAKDFRKNYEAFSIKRREKQERGAVDLTEDELLDLAPPEVDDPSILFFIWAVIMNYHETAKHFWVHGDNYLAKALIGMRLYKSMAETLDVGDKEDEMLENADDFGEMAIELLQQCHDNDDKELRQLLVAQNSLSRTHSVLGLAELADHEDFIAHADPQRILNEIWSGAIKQEEWMLPKVLTGLFCPPLIPWILDYDRVGNVFEATKEEVEQATLAREDSLLSLEETDVDTEGEPKLDGGHLGVGETTSEGVSVEDMPDNGTTSDDSTKALQKQKSSKMKRVNTYDHAMLETEPGYEYAEGDEPPEVPVFQRLVYFYKAPVTKFYCNMIIYMGFLLTFTYLVLSELPEDVHYIELILASIVLSITSEEIRQLGTQGGRVSRKVKDHLSSVWNWMDLTGIFFFWLPFFLRFAHLSHSEDVARLFYILDLFFWYMRVLNIFTVSRRLGPVVTIILNMIPNLVRFSFVWIVFMAAFGVISKAVSTPQRFGDVTAYDIINVISLSYWQTYGELFLDDLDADMDLKANITCTDVYNDDSGLPPCPFLPRLSIYFLAIYMLIGNVLLMNLLIAMFSSVYEEVNSRSLTDWKNKRMSLIVEYHTRPFLPPPLTLIQHLFILFTWKQHAAKARLAIGLTVKQSEQRLRQLENFEEENKEEYLVNLSNKKALDVSKQMWGLEKKVEEASAQIREMKQNLERQARDHTESLISISEKLTQLLKNSKPQSAESAAKE